MSLNWFFFVNMGILWGMIYKKGHVAYNSLRVKIGGRVYASAMEASLSLGFAKDSIASAKYRGRDSVKGMKFEYITE